MWAPSRSDACRRQLHRWGVQGASSTPTWRLPDSSAAPRAGALHAAIRSTPLHIGQVLGPPADVYSLGVLVFELLSGEVPFDFDYDANGEAQDSYMGAQGLAGGTSGRGTPARGATEARGG